MTTRLRGLAPARRRTGRSKRWWTYEYPTDMVCASIAQGRRCLLGGDHALYGGLTSAPEHVAEPGRIRDGQHEDHAAWWEHRSGPMVLTGGPYRSFEEGKAAESARIGTWRYLANQDENWDNPCRWYFGPPRNQPPAPPAARRRRIRRRVPLRWKLAAVILSWLVLALVLYRAVQPKLPGRAGMELSALAASAAFVAAWWQRPRRRRRR